MQFVEKREHAAIELSNFMLCIKQTLQMCVISMIQQPYHYYVPETEQMPNKIARNTSGSLK